MEVGEERPKRRCGWSKKTSSHLARLRESLKGEAPDQTKKEKKKATREAEEKTVLPAQWKKGKQLVCECRGKAGAWEKRVRKKRRTAKNSRLPQGKNWQPGTCKKKRGAAVLEVLQGKRNTKSTSRPATQSEKGKRGRARNQNEGVGQSQQEKKRKNGSIPRK